jgi:hypothetical protein
MLGQPLNKLDIKATFTTAYGAPLVGWLLDFGTTTLNEKQQHDYKQHASDDPNNGYIVHAKPPFL